MQKDQPVFVRVAIPATLLGGGDRELTTAEKARENRSEKSEPKYDTAVAR